MVESCTNCIMTKMDDPTLTFDEDGVCSLCRKFQGMLAELPGNKEESDKILLPMIEKIKERGKGHPYDCITGVSGGVDSTYVCLLMKRYGLRPLCVHFDNGWNTELAVENINRMIDILGFDLETYVIDWEDFRELQIAYLKSGVIDIEVATDHAIYGSLYSMAIKNDIPFIISGVNTATEDFMPYHWCFDKHDDANIKDIYRKHGSKRPLKNYPFVDARLRRKIKRSNIEVIRILNMLPINIDEMKADITRELGWKPYDGKHHESIFTRFYQGYILPRKFGVDKRKAHLSNLVCAGMTTRQQALAEFQQDIYPPSQAREDLEFVSKKLQFSVEEFEQLMREPPRRHLDFANSRWFFARYPVAKPLLPLWRRYKAWRDA
ncbi:MAG: N-acetyl sugar amidotransferase [Minwuia sp.]|nr:N-acetyl sugar amidotransferase [Minwuia sp.]